MGPGTLETILVPVMLWNSVLNGTMSIHFGGCNALGATQVLSVNAFSFGLGTRVGKDLVIPTFQVELARPRDSLSIT